MIALTRVNCVTGTIDPSKNIDSRLMPIELNSISSPIMMADALPGQFEALDTTIAVALPKINPSPI